MWNREGEIGLNDIKRVTLKQVCNIKIRYYEFNTRKNSRNYRL